MNKKILSDAIQEAISKAQLLGVARPWHVKVVNDQNLVLDESPLRLHGMLLSDGPEYDLAKVDGITETNPILVLENNVGEVVRVPMTFEQSQ